MNKLGCLDKIPSPNQLDGIVYSGFNTYDLQMLSDEILYYQYEEWISGLIRRSKGLSDFFWVSWEFDKFSDLQLQTMSCIHKYEIGLLSANTMKYLLQKDSNKYWPQLDSENKMAIHEKAMELGANDPTKPDYSKYLVRQTKRKALSNAVPLLHDCYTNELFAINESKEDATIKIQSAWRGFCGKKIGKQLAQNKAFYEAEDKSKLIIAEEIEKEYYEKSLQVGNEATKWNAKIRLLQVQYRARRIDISRGQVIEIMKAEERKRAYEDVEKKYDEMATKKGVPLRVRKSPLKVIDIILDDLSSVGEVTQDKIEKVINRQIQSEPIKFQSMRTDEVTKPKEEKENEEKEEEKENNEIKINNIEKEKGKDIKKKDIKNNIPESSKIKQENDLPTPIDVNKNEVTTPTSPKEEEEDMVIETRNYDLNKRKHNLLIGLHPDDIFNLGETDEEKRYRRSLCEPELTSNQLFLRLKAMCTSVTRLKAHELLLELPSKQLILQKVKKFQSTNDLSKYISDHFGFKENISNELALCLYGMYINDFYSGMMEKRVKDIAKAREELLNQMKCKQVNELYDIIKSDDEQQKNV